MVNQVCSFLFFQPLALPKAEKIKKSKLDSLYPQRKAVQGRYGPPEYHFSRWFHASLLMSSHFVSSGSLVGSNKGSFFIGPGLGPL